MKKVSTILQILAFLPLFICTASNNLWKCDDGSIIKLSQVCDGEIDCTDNSDETLNQCRNYICGTGYSQCSYGACVQKATTCTEIIELRNMFAVNDSTCKITKIPSNGFAQYLYSPDIHLKVGEIVPDFVKVKFNCIENYRIVGNDIILCRDGKWDGGAPECEPVCHPIVSTVTFFASCTYQSGVVNCSEPTVPGTVAAVKCKYGYRSINAEQQIVCESDGRWRPEPAPCSQICGEQFDASITQFPWHVTIYKQTTFGQTFEQICAGTILNAKMLITATHCLWNEEKNDVDDRTLFRIKTGKPFREYDDGKMSEVQIHTFRTIFFHTNYDFTNGFKYDVAVMVLDKYIEFNPYTSPICVDFRLRDEEQYVSPGLRGIMGGWGRNDTTGKPGAKLQLMEHSVISREKCQSDSATDFLKYLTTDKFCAENLSPGVDVYPHDSGSGLVFPSEINGKTKYFLRAVASIGVFSPKRYSAFASFGTYLNSIYKYTNLFWFRTVGTFRTSASKATELHLIQCTITDIPSNGFVYHIGSSTQIGSRHPIPNYTGIRYGCNHGYALKGKPVNVCVNGTWSNIIPECSLNSAVLRKRWRCGNGQSIELSKICDGEADCSNYSDELSSLCENFVCGPGLKKCLYGACVDNKTDCGGLIDERISDQDTDGFCKITKIPPNGFAQFLYSPGTHLHVNEMVSNFGKVQFTCIEKHRIVGNDTISCVDGVWKGRVPVCEPFCPPIIFIVTLTTRCYYRNSTVDCTELARPGTIANVNCNYGYESINAPQQTFCGLDGRWQPEPAPCTQICGERFNTNLTQLPWHVTIYKRLSFFHPFEQICGGTILNAKVVISAAHCFWDKMSSTYYSDALYMIKTGKTFRDSDSEQENREVQNHSFDHIMGPSSIMHSRRGIVEDLAVLILSNYIEFNAYTSPICIDYQLENEEKFVSSGLRGLMSGWGRNGSTDNPNSILNVFELEVITREKCKNDSSQEFLEFFTVDKFCAKSLLSGLNACPEDSGTGLVFPKQSNGKTKYFLRAVASIARLNSTCNANQYGVFGNIASFIRPLHETDIAYKPIEAIRNTDAQQTLEITLDQCNLAELPSNGYARFLDTPIHATVGTFYLNDEIMLFGCNVNFTLKGDPTNVCINGSWTNAIPECVPFSTGLSSDCPVLPTPRIGQIQYYAKDGFLLGSNKGERFYSVGTMAKINCLTGFEISGGSQQTLTCTENANWSPDLKDITCRPVCGKQAPTGAAFIAGGQETNITYAPWHVGIYKLKDAEVIYQCGGTILTEKVIISAIHCFWDPQINIAYDARLFKVAAGKQYIDYKSNDEPHKVQYFQIVDLNYHSDYRHASGNYALDIVLALLDVSIHFQHHIAPICVQMNSVTIYDIPVYPGLNGTLAGWGLTESGRQSKRLKIVDLPTVDKDKCIADSDSGFRDFITADKFCAGHWKLNISACQGDSGGGLVFPKTINGSRRYFLRGVVSVGSNALINRCDSSKYTTFTNVIYHDKLVRSALLSP